MKALRIAWRLLPGLTVLGLILLAASPLWAQASQPNNCSGTVSTVAAAVAFPTSGATGPSKPTQYVTITNPHASNNLGVNVEPGGTAAIGSAGTVTIVPGGSMTWWQPAYPPPAAVSIIASGSSTPYTCMYK